MIFDNFKQIPNDLDIVNIGSGISFHDFVWDESMKLKGYNLAICPEDFRYDARIIKNYGFHLKKGGVVLIVVCPLSFGKNEYLYKDFFSEKYVDLLPQEDVDISKNKYYIFLKIKYLYKANFFLHKIPKFLNNKVHYIKRGFKKESRIDSLVRGWIHDSPGLNDLKKSNQAQLFKSVFEEKKRDLSYVVDNCLNQNLKPIILLPPISDELYSRMSPDFLKSFMYDNILDEVNRGIFVLDYLRDKRFVENSKYHPNGIFLKDGNEIIFTKTVIEDILNNNFSKMN